MTEALARLFPAPGDGVLPLHEPRFAAGDVAAVGACVEGTWVSYAGPHVAEFEAQLAEATGRRHAIATVSGTAAVHLCLLAAGVRDGDEVLMPALTFVATANASIYCRAIPHFIDSSPDTLGVCPQRLRAYLEEITEQAPDGTCINRRTGRPIRALVTVHVLGHPTDDDALAEVADAFGLAFVNDATESLGSLYKGRPAASSGHVAALSFNGNKILTTGGGGAVVCNDDDLADWLRRITTTAKDPHPWAFHHSEPAFNYRLPGLNAALGVPQMKRLAETVDRKRRLADHIRQGLEGVPGLRVIKEPVGAHSNYWLNAVLLDDPEGLEPTLKALHDQRILARPLWTLMPRLPFLKRAPADDLPVAEDLVARTLCLPSSPHLINDLEAAGR